MQPELSGEFEDGSFHHGEIQSRYYWRNGYGRAAVCAADSKSSVVYPGCSGCQHTQCRHKTYAQALGEKWHMADPIPESVKSMIVMDAEADAEEIAKQVDFVFCAVNMKKDEIKALEERYAKLECPVVSNNSAHRHTPDVPMVVPEINADHIRIIDAQRRRLGTQRGFIAVSYTHLTLPTT